MFGRGDDISIVGYACRLPGASNAHEFWQLLIDERCSVSRIAADRFATERFQHPIRTTPGKSVTFCAGVLDDVFGFDAAFFGMSPREALQTDPQQRLLLQVVWESLEHAGVPPSSLAGSQVGVFVGASSSDYVYRFVLDPAAIDTQMMTGNTLSIISNRISYQFDLKGPSFTVDTACSSSLVALNQACEAIHSGIIDTAIVAGVSILGAPFPFIGFSRAFMLSPTGLCRAFDADGDGYVRSEGVVAVVIQASKSARRDKRMIHATIAGWGTNSDGRTVGLSMPSSESQSVLLKQVYDRFKLDPEDLSFVEAHGTGTRVGDPAEAFAIGKLLGVRRQAPLPIGSVKTNIGHLEPASGLAGLLKAVLALKHEVLPASLHFRTPNPDIPFDELNLCVAATRQALPERARPRHVGISSFGFGGSNAHIVLREAKQPTRTHNLRANVPVVLSGQSQTALNSVAGLLRRKLADVGPSAQAAIVNAAAHTRDQLEHRAIVFPGTRDQLLTALDDLAEGRASKLAITGKAISRECKIAFAFSGNGSQWAGMGRAALVANAQFRQSFKEVDKIYARQDGWSLMKCLHSSELPELLDRAATAQPLLFALQVATVEALAQFGIEPSVAFGHSVGEVAAAWASGALSLEEAIKVIHARSSCQEVTRNLGGMAAVVMAEDEAFGLLTSQFPGLEIAAVNSARSITISGKNEELDRFLKHARKQRWPFRRLDVAYPYHSKIIDPIREDLLAALGDLSCNAGRIPFVSSVYGQETDGADLDSAYWWENVRKPVHFHAAVKAVLQSQVGLILEIGPSPVLTGYLSDAIKDAGATAVSLSSFERNEDEGVDPVLKTAAKVLVHGGRVSKTAMFGQPAAAAPQLPSYPWENKKYCVEPSPESLMTMFPAVHSLLGSSARKDNTTFHNHIDIELFPWLKDHKVENATVMPGAAIVEIALAAAREVLGEGPVELRGCAILRPLVFEQGVVRETMVRVSPEEFLIDFMSRPRGSDHEWTHHARANFSRSPVATIKTPERQHSARKTVEADDVYRMMHAFQLNYGPSFRRLASVDLVDHQTAEVKFNDAPANWPQFLLDPTVLDSALHGVLWSLFADQRALPNDRTFVPVRIDTLRLLHPGATIRSCRLRFARRSEGSAIADLTFLADDGTVVAAAQGGQFAEIRLSSGNPSENVYRTIAVPLATANAISGLRSVAPNGLLPLAHRLDLITDNAPMRGDALLLLEAAVRAVAYEAFKALYGSAAFSPSGSSSQPAIRPHLRDVATRLLEDLSRDGAAEKTGSTWKLTPKSTLPPTGELVQALLASNPEHGTEATLLAYMVQELPAFLSADATPRPLSAALREALETSLSANASLTSALGKIVQEITRNWPAGNSLRILILGVADPLFVRFILDAVPLQLGKVSVTDFDSDRLNRLGARLGRQIGITVHPWDRIGSECLGMFDLVIGGQTIHHWRDPRHVLDTLRASLVEHGAVLFAEQRSSVFVDLLRVAGLFAANDVSDGETGTGLERSNTAWEGALKSVGFTAACIANVNADESDGVLITAVKAKATDGTATTQPPDVLEPIYLVDCEGDDGEFGRALQSILAHSGRESLRLLDQEVMAIADRHAVHASGDPEAAVGAAPCSVVFAARTPAKKEDPASWVHDRCVSLINIVKSLGQRSARVWLVAPGAVRGFAGQEWVRPEAASLWGFARVAANERPNLDFRLVDVSPTMPADEAARLVAAEIARLRPEREVLIDRTAAYGLRVVRGELATAIDVTTESMTSRLEIEGQGSLDRLAWRLTSRQPPAEGEVEIEVHATGLNFRDVMWSLGLLPAEALEDGFAGPTIGMECAGVVVRVGSGTGQFAVGDRCVAFAPGAFARHVTVPEFAVARIPPSLSFDAAATIPVAYLTAYYSLVHVARIQAGERVLIHGGAGGVGLAAIQIVKWRGAIPIATAGNPEKRALLALLGVEHVFDSRSQAFSEGVMEITSGLGVDVVLNSLAGEAMERSVGCLKSFGRFIELGKRDFFANTRLGLRPFRRNLSYFGVDADQLLTSQRPLTQRLFRELLALFESGELTPSPYRVFNGADVTAAFRLMQQAGHVGKIVVHPGQAAVHSSRIRPTMQVRQDGTYVIIGGLGGFGLALARRLSLRGAKHIVLVGRRGLSGQDAEQAVADLRARGTTIQVERLDAADGPSLASLFAQLSKKAPPVRGVFHTAMVLDDALILNLTPARIESVLRAKITVAGLLDTLTRGLDLDWFVLFSSATTIVGNPGQANYVAANAFLEGLAQQRRAAGLPALAVSWGAISDAGYLARTAQVNELLTRKLGRHALTVEEALDGLEGLLGLDQAAPTLAAVGYARLDWKAITKELRIASTPLLEWLRQESSADDSRASGGALITELAQLPADQARSRVVDVLCVEIGKILRIPAAQIDRNKPLTDIGVDSLMGVELRLAAEEQLGIEIPLMAIGGAGSLNDLATRILKQIGDEEHGQMPVELAALAHSHSEIENATSKDLVEISTVIREREAAVKQVF